MAGGNHIDMDDHKGQDGKGAGQMNHGHHLQRQAGKTPGRPGVISPVKQTGNHLDRQQDGSQNQIGDSLQRIVLGVLAFGHGVSFTAEDSIHVITDHPKHLFSGGNILPPFPGGKDPEYEKQEGDQPGVADKIVYLDRCLKSKKAVKAFDFKTGDQK